MKILYMIPWFHAGTGQETTLQQIITYGNGKWESVLLSNKLHLERGIFPDGYSVGLKRMKRYYSLMLPHQALPPWAKEYDIIHIKSGAPYLKWVSQKEMPLIYTLQGPWITSTLGLKGKFQGLLANITESKSLLEKADVLVGVSKWICEYYKNSMGLVLKYIPDTFNLDLYRYTEKMPDVNNLKLLIVGDWDGFKGRKRQHEFIDKMPLIARELPGIKLRLVGLGKENIQRLSEYADKLGCAEFIELYGKVPETELAHLYSSSDILVVPSTFEGFHRPTLEAMASGTPVLARDTTPIVGPLYSAHFLHVRESGGGDFFHVSYDNVVEKIWTIIKNYKTMSIKGMEYAKQFDSMNVLPAYEKLYYSLI